MRDWPAVLGVLALLAARGAAQTASDPAYAVSVSLADLVTNFQQMAVGDKRVATGLTAGAAVVVYSKLAKTTFRVVVYNGDPATATTTVLYTANYRWVSSAKTLIAVQCTFAPPPRVIQVIMNCDHGLRMAVLLMRMVLRPPLTDIANTGYQALVNCLQSKTGFVPSQAYQVCYLLPLNDLTVAAEVLMRQQALGVAGPITQMNQLISIARAHSARAPDIVADKGVL